MPAATTILAGIGLAAAVGGTAYSMSQASKAREEQSDVLKKQQAEQARLANEAKQKEFAVQRQAFARAEVARLRSTPGAAAPSQSIGMTQGPTTGTKTVIGS